MPRWPNTTPEDLRDRLAHRSFDPDSFYAEIKDWLSGHNVSAPDEMPDRLRTLVSNVLGFRQYGHQELYGEVRDWLNKAGIDAPENLPEAKELRPDMDQ